MPQAPSVAEKKSKTTAVSCAAYTILNDLHVVRHTKNNQLLSRRFPLVLLLNVDSTLTKIMAFGIHRGSTIYYEFTQTKNL